MDEKTKLRARMRALRRSHVAALPAATRALLFLRPPSAIVGALPDGAAAGLYHATPQEAPTRSYAKWFQENDHQIALPWFADRDSPMVFRAWTDPFEDTDLEPGPFGLAQPPESAPLVSPALVFVPLLGFTDDGARLGQGGGHYDRWLAAHRGITAVGLGWDCQRLDSLPCEAHDVTLDAVVTPTRLYTGDS